MTVVREDTAFIKGYEKGLSRTVAALSEAIADERKIVDLLQKSLGFASN